MLHSRVIIQAGYEEMKYAVFLRCFEKPKGSQIFPTISQNTVGTRFTTTIKVHKNLALRSPRYSDKTVAVFLMFLRSAKSKQKHRKLYAKALTYQIAFGFIALQRASTTLLATSTRWCTHERSSMLEFAWPSHCRSYMPSRLNLYPMRHCLTDLRAY